MKKKAALAYKQLLVFGIDFFLKKDQDYLPITTGLHSTSTPVHLFDMELVLTCTEFFKEVTVVSDSQNLICPGHSGYKTFGALCRFYKNIKIYSIFINEKDNLKDKFVVINSMVMLGKYLSLDMTFTEDRVKSGIMSDKNLGDILAAFKSAPDLLDDRFIIRSINSNTMMNFNEQFAPHVVLSKTKTIQQILIDMKQNAEW